MEIAYEKKYYELERDQWWCRVRRELIVGLMRSYPKSSRILEIGCAGGYLLQTLKENGFQNISGIDVSHEAVSLCRAKGLDVRLGDGGDARFPDQSFDVIIASDVLEHIRDDDAALRSWSRMLVPEGALMCFVPAFQFLWSGHDVANRHWRRFSLRELARKAADAGLSVRAQSYWNFFLFLPAAVIRGAGRVVRRRAVQPHDQFYAFRGGLLNILLLGLLRLENQLIFFGVRFPFGVSCFVVAEKSAVPCVSGKKKAICFVVPEYSRDVPTHVNHVYDLIREASRLMDIAVYAERVTGAGVLPETVSVVTGTYKNSFLSFLESIIILYRMRASGISDFYIHYSFRSACAAALVARVCGGRVFYWNCGEPWKYRRNVFREWFERRVYHAIDFLVTGTESLKKKYAETYRMSEQKIKMMPNWIDMEKFKIQKSKLKIKEMREHLNINADDKIILFAHRLSKRKGAHYLPKIIKAFKNENIVCVVIGGGPERKNIILQIKNWKLENKVRWLGWISNNDMPLYYAFTNVFMMPSDEEGFPRVLLEAMALGVPFVAFDVGGVREIIPPEFQKYVVPSRNIGQFINAVRDMLSVPKEKKELLANAETEWVKKFDIRAVLPIFEKLFQ